ncbi:hypothetical protein ACOME3_005346 [Neoechinorhynchus agilis]
MQLILIFVAIFATFAFCDEPKIPESLIVIDDTNTTVPDKSVAQIGVAVKPQWIEETELPAEMLKKIMEDERIPKKVVDGKRWFFIPFLLLFPLLLAFGGGCCGGYGGFRGYGGYGHY